MIPIVESDRDSLIAFIENERDELERELKTSEAITDDERDDAVNDEENDIRNALAFANALIEGLREGRYIVLDTSPSCFAVVDGKQCDKKANFAPVLMAMHDGRPVCQANREPPLLLCEHHATGEIDTFFGGEAWRYIQQQAHAATGGIVVRKEDARLMFHQLDTNQIVPPPNGPSIALAK